MLVKLTRKSIRPLYFQIYDHIQHQIRSGNLVPGDQIPAEMDLMKEYKVARITVRHAISELVNEGVLERKAGKGTFISKPKIDRTLVDVTSFSSRLAAIGLHASAKLLSKELIIAPAKIAEELEVAEGSRLLFINRLRFSDQDPLVLERVYLSLDRFPGLDAMDLENNSLYALLNDKFNVKPVRSKKTLEIVTANLEESRLFASPSPHTPLFLMRTTVYGNDYPIEFAKILMRGDRFRFQV